MNVLVAGGVKNEKNDVQEQKHLTFTDDYNCFHFLNIYFLAATVKGSFFEAQKTRLGIQIRRTLKMIVSYLS